jgi:hypothetical protein
MLEKLRASVERELALDPCRRIVEVANLSRIPPTNRLEFQKHITEIVLPEWYSTTTGQHERADQLDAIIKLTAKLAAALDPAPRPLSRHEGTLDYKLDQFVCMLRSIHVAALHESGMRALKRKNRGGQPRKERWRAFAESFYRKVLQCGGSLTNNKNASEGHISPGTFKATLKLLEPLLPPKLLPKGLSLGALQNIKEKVDDESCRVA